MLLTRWPVAALLLAYVIINMRTFNLYHQKQWHGVSVVGCVPHEQVLDYRSIEGYEHILVQCTTIVAITCYCQYVLQNNIAHISTTYM